MRALTSLRALLAWWVVMFHLAPLAPFRLDHSMRLLNDGPVLVDCFFVLSGFVLFHVHPRVLDGGDKGRSIAKFLLARLARLYPVHLAMLAAFVALLGGLHLVAGFSPSDAAAFSARALIAQALLLNGFAVPTGEAWNFPSWSVSSECAAYIAAPLLFHCILAARRRWLLLVGAAIVVCVVGGIENGRLQHFSWALPRVLVEFTLGALLRLLVGIACERLHQVRRSALAAGWIAMLLLALSSHHGLLLAAMVWLILFLSLTPGWSGPVGAVGRYLGESSYAVYMCHAFILLLWAGLYAHARLVLPASPLAALLLICVSVQATASLLHHLIEKPCRAVIRSWASRWLDQPRKLASNGRGVVEDYLSPGG